MFQFDNLYCVQFIYSVSILKSVDKLKNILGFVITHVWRLGKSITGFVVRCRRVNNFFVIFKSQIASVIYFN